MPIGRCQGLQRWLRCAVHSCCSSISLSQAVNIASSLCFALRMLVPRTMVFFAFPVFMSICIVLKGILLFKRGTIADKVVSSAVQGGKGRGRGVA